MAVCQNLVIKIAGKWMFIPLKMALIGVDPYQYIKYQTEDPVFKDFSKDDIIGHFRTPPKPSVARRTEASPGLSLQCTHRCLHTGAPHLDRRNWVITELET